MGVIPEIQEQGVNAVEEVLKPQETAEEPKPVEEGKVEVEVEEPKEEPKPEVKKEKPFHEHPRWRKLEREAAEARLEAKAAREALEQSQKQAQQSQEKQKMPQAFINLFGSNEEAWAEWQNLGLMTKEEVEQRIQARFDEAKKSEEQAESFREKAVETAEEQLAELSEESGIDFSVESDARNRLLDIAVKYQLLDQNGVPNIATAYQIYQDLYPPKDGTAEITERKQVAARTGAKTNSNTKESDVYTPKRLAEIKKRGGIHSFLE